MKKDEYKCEACGEVYKKGWADEEAEEEADAIWTKEVCDYCFQRGMNKYFRNIN